jgi:hypothetical protein
MAPVTHTFKLSAPLKTHHGEVSELKLKEPKARLAVKYDDPFQLRPMKDRDDQLEYVFNNEAVSKYAAEMSGVDELILAELSVSDFYRLRQEVANIILGVVPDKNPSEQPVA